MGSSEPTTPVPPPQEQPSDSTPWWLRKLGPAGPPYPPERFLFSRKLGAIGPVPHWRYDPTLTALLHPPVAPKAGSSSLELPRPPASPSISHSMAEQKGVVSVKEEPDDLKLSRSEEVALKAREDKSIEVISVGSSSPPSVHIIPSSPALVPDSSPELSPQIPSSVPAVGASNVASRQQSRSQLKSKSVRHHAKEEASKAIRELAEHDRAMKELLEKQPKGGIGKGKGKGKGKK
ncbi:hypothetical protein I203_103175 [Kwoniella mangroviensis CBS 8507]|uniref:uncharacterized protein n=1 Tax=Kwoniella mangroviensis CBS 8507 TaxID=1296122 RepID=UPI00080D633D|nr:uncharacterized protein I203_07451 [Kwoniella mangroviensis CBS 8507]OCF63385.1 hypothetical protein I203_07451 [Kwoniella mangroviensis CBS 8507]